MVFAQSVVDAASVLWRKLNAKHYSHVLQDRASSSSYFAGV
jgi:hypothetical protein